MSSEVIGPDGQPPTDSTISMRVHLSPEMYERIKQQVGRYGGDYHSQWEKMSPAKRKYLRRYYRIGAILRKKGKL